MTIRFSDKCVSHRPLGWWSDDYVEMRSTRLHTLREVFGAILERKAKKRTNLIKTLTIQEFQNTPIADFISSKLFRSVAKDITDLRLQVLFEYNESESDYDIDLEERRTFEPWPHKSLLPVFSTSLALVFDKPSGVAPGYFDGKGLSFPHFKALKVGKLVIAHHDQFDWVLSWTSLETLRLYRCTIASHLYFPSNSRFQGVLVPSLERRNVQTHG